VVVGVADQGDVDRPLGEQAFALGAQHHFDVDQALGVRPLRQVLDEAGADLDRVDGALVAHRLAQGHQEESRTRSDVGHLLPRFERELGHDLRALGRDLA